MKQMNEQKSIGIYFDGVSDGYDCECCGDRWYPCYGEGSAWAKEAYDTYVHYLDGRIEAWHPNDKKVYEKQNHVDPNAATINSKYKF